MGGGIQHFYFFCSCNDDKATRTLVKYSSGKIFSNVPPTDWQENPAKWNIIKPRQDLEYPLADLKSFSAP